jgi:hypothetical protein
MAINAKELQMYIHEAGHTSVLDTFYEGLSGTKLL